MYLVNSGVGIFQNGWVRKSAGFGAIPPKNFSFVGPQLRYPRMNISNMKKIITITEIVK